MADKNIKIENSNGGIVNIYYGDENNDNTKSANIKMAAIDKYSSPLSAFVDISPWGEKMHKVSLLVKNDLIGQVIQSNYLFYNEESKAKEIYAKIVKLMESYKDKAEKGLVHSAILSQQMRNEMSLFKSDLTPPESNDVFNRFQNNDTVTDLASGIPPGLLTYDENHFPDHNGIVKQASKKDELHLIKIAENIENNIKNKFDRNYIKILCQFTLPEVTDTEKVAILKRNALASIRPILSNFNQKSDRWIESWIKSNIERIDTCINDIYAIAFEKIADIKEPEQTDADRYEFFIFDADRTLWDSNVPAAETIPPYEFEILGNTLNGDSVLDSKGNRITLKNGIRSVLERLKTMDKILGLISKSEKQGIPYEDQPVLHLLKKFGILALFDSPIAICQDLPKSIFIPQDINQKHVLFIDDDLKNLIDVKENTDADVVDIKKIEQLAKKKDNIENWYKLAQQENIEKLYGLYNWLVKPDSSGNIWSIKLHPSKCPEDNTNNLRHLLRIYSDSNQIEDWTKEPDNQILGAWQKYRPFGWDNDPAILYDIQRQILDETSFDNQEHEHFGTSDNSWCKIAQRFPNFELIPETTFKTEEGKFTEYSVLANTEQPIYPGPKTKKRAGTITVYENKDGFVIRNIVLSDDIRRQGIGTQIYEFLNNKSLENTGNPLNSSKPRKIENTGEIVNDLSPASKGLWEKFVNDNKAETIEQPEGISYRFKGSDNNSWYKLALEKREIDGKKYIEVPKKKCDGGCGSPSGTMGVVFEMKKKDSILWMPEKYLKNYKKDCKKIEDDLKDFEPKNYPNLIEKEAKREYIPQSERPKKPNDGKEYELDHKKSQYKFKNKDNANKKENLQWLEKDKHKEKSKKEGDFSYGGDDRHKKLKNKGKKNYSKYQSNAAKEKVKQEKDKLGDKGFSDLQRERVNKRWHKSNSNNWYKLAYNTQLLDIIKSETEDLLGENPTYLNGIIFHMKNYIRKNNITLEDFYNNQWIKLKNSIENYVSQEKCIEGPIETEKNIRLGFPSPKDFYDYDNNLIIEKGKTIDEDDYNKLLEFEYLSDLGLIAGEDGILFNEYYVCFLCDDDEFKAIAKNAKEAEIKLDEIIRNNAFKKIIDFLKT